MCCSANSTVIRDQLTRMTAISLGSRFYDSYIRQIRSRLPLLLRHLCGCGNKLRHELGSNVMVRAERSSSANVREGLNWHSASGPEFDDQEVAANGSIVNEADPTRRQVAADGLKRRPRRSQLLVKFHRRQRCDNGVSGGASFFDIAILTRTEALRELEHLVIDGLYGSSIEDYRRGSYAA